MKQKTIITIIFGMILLIGLVAAAGDIINVFPLELEIPNFIAGGTTSTEFSFDYPEFDSVEYPNQEDNAPLMIKVDITSEGPTPDVWKGDFELDGSMINKGWFILPDTYYTFNCNENDFTYKYETQIQEIKNIPNGTFYCYNPQFLGMREGSSNEVSLSITSDPALYPGTYNFSVGLYHPQKEYINVDVTSIDDSNHVVVGTDTTVMFNMDFEIGGGNAIKMQMSDLVDGFIGSGEIGFVIGDGETYTVEDLNARLVYEGITYFVGNEYGEWTKEGGGNEPIIFPVGADGIARGSAIFMMDITATMLPGNYHGTYQFDVTQENEM